MRLIEECLNSLWGSIFIIGSDVAHSHQIKLIRVAGKDLKLFEWLIQP